MANKRLGEEDDATLYANLRAGAYAAAEQADSGEVGLPTSPELEEEPPGR